MTLASNLALYHFNALNEMLSFALPRFPGLQLL
jgi:hypothetical protein